jgi:hypothetical protein
MALWAWLDLKPLDIAAFVISSILGGIAGFFFLPNASLFSLVSGMVTYHLFLVWLVFEQDREGLLTLSVATTVLYHLACIALVYAIHWIIGALSSSFLMFLLPGRDGVVYALGILVPALAIFERGWLFSGTGRRINQPTVVAADSAVFTSTTDDYIEWQRLLASGKRPPAKHGLTLKDEFEQWAAARAQARAAAASTAASTDQPA